MAFFNILDNFQYFMRFRRGEPPKNMANWDYSIIRYFKNFYNLEKDRDKAKYMKN